MKEIYDKIQSGIDVRENLIKLKSAIKEASPDAFLSLLEDEREFFSLLLEHEDPKVRKNTIIIMGLCQQSQLSDMLVEGYQREQTLFVRPEYVKVLYQFPVKEYLDVFRARKKEIQLGKEENTEQKHISMELRYLTQIIGKYETKKSHRFIGNEEPSKIFLTVPKGLEKVLKQAVTQFPATEMSNGVLLTCNDLEQLSNIRCYGEMLFLVPGLENVEAKEEEIGKAIISAQVLDYLDKRHIGEDEYRFRVEIRGLEPEKKQTFLKKCIKEMEAKSGHRLINSVSDYEVEFRIMMKKNKKVTIFLKLYTKEDNRFSYRRHDLAVSIRPSTAAMICAYIAPYMKKKARVLDPFCGLGTLLYERNFLDHCDTLYGVDISQNAIDSAKEESEILALPVHFINKDFLHFQHEYQFDEIITDLPWVTANKEEREVRELYLHFLSHCDELLAPTGYLFVYTVESKLFEKCVEKDGRYQILDEHLIYHKQGSKIYVLDRK